MVLEKNYCGAPGALRRNVHASMFVERCSCVVIILRIQTLISPHPSVCFASRFTLDVMTSEFSRGLEVSRHFSLEGAEWKGKRVLSPPSQMMSSLLLNEKNPSIRYDSG